MYCKLFVTFGPQATHTAGLWTVKLRSVTFSVTTHPPTPPTPTEKKPFDRFLARTLVTSKIISDFLNSSLLLWWLILLLINIIWDFVRLQNKYFFQAWELLSLARWNQDSMTASWKKSRLPAPWNLTKTFETPFWDNCSNYTVMQIPGHSLNEKRLPQYNIIHSGI